MLAIEIQIRLKELQVERLLAASEGLAANALYMADLEDEIAELSDCLCRGSGHGDRDAPRRALRAAGGLMPGTTSQFKASGSARLHRDHDPFRYYDRRVPALATAAPLAMALAPSSLGPTVDFAAVAPARRSSAPCDFNGRDRRALPALRRERRGARLLDEQRRHDDRARQPGRHGGEPEPHLRRLQPLRGRGRRGARLLGQHRRRDDRARQPRRQRGGPELHRRPGRALRGRGRRSARLLGRHQRHSDRARQPRRQRGEPGSSTT